MCIYWPTWAWLILSPYSNCLPAVYLTVVNTDIGSHLIALGPFRATAVIKGVHSFSVFLSLSPLRRGAKMGPCSLAEFHTRLTLPLERLIPVQPFTRHARTLCVPGWAGCAGRAGPLPRDVIIAGEIATLVRGCSWVV